MYNKYTEEVSEINPMETAPVWGYYGNSIETIQLFYNDSEHNEINTCIAYYDRDSSVWREHYSGYAMDEELLGWLPAREITKECLP